MEFSKLVDVYKELEGTTKRLKKVDIISEFLKKVDKDDLKEVVYLLQGKVFPKSDERKIGFSSKLMLKAISIATGESQAVVENLWKKTGDLGKVTGELMDKRKQRTLTSKRLDIKKIIENIRKLCEFTGAGSVDKKVKLVAELISNAGKDEAKYITGIVLGELRIGVSEGIIRDSIAKTFNMDVKEVEHAYNMTVDYGEVAEMAKAGRRLKGVEIRMSKPIKVMLALKAKDVEEAFEALGKPLQAEYKLDGFRLQIHKANDNISLFTRRMENVTTQFPDVVGYTRKYVKGKSFVIDCEAVGFDKNTGRSLPFQNISQRIKRKYDIDKMAKNFPVEVNVFDIVYYNGENLMNKPLKERRKILEGMIVNTKRKLVVTKKLVSDNAKEINEFFEKSKEVGNEGLMLKNLDGVYRPGRYVGGWLKLKTVMESLDLVITGAQWGEGKRAEWLSSFVLSCRKGNKFLTIGKVGTGIKEKEEGVTFGELTKELKKDIISEKGKDVILKPRLVVEVAYEEVQESPTYESGYALRFPRLVRIRYDKGAKQASELSYINKLYKEQRFKK